MVTATIDKPIIDNKPQVPPPSFALTVERLPLTMRQIVSTVFGHLNADYEGIFAHLLHYAQVERSGNMAVINIPNQWRVHQQDSAWPCCYATLNTFIRLLRALGILQKVPQRIHRAAKYYLPLTDYMIPLDAFADLDRLMDPTYTKNCKVRGLAEEVKKRLHLYISQKESTIRFEPVDSALQTALSATQQLFEALEGVNARKKQQLITQVSQTMEGLYAAGKIAGSRFSAPAVDSPPALSLLEEVQTDKQVQERDTPVDGSTTTLDSDRGRKANSVTRVVDSGGAVDSNHLCSSILLSQVVDFSTIESTARPAQSVCQSEYKEQNLPAQYGNIVNAVDFGDRNLHAVHPVVDSGSYIDNDRNIYSKKLLQENHTIVIENTIPESKTKQPRALYRPMDARTARMLAGFVEGNPENFRAYITLSQKYHPQIIRAAVVNMLAHTYFPDLEGDLPGEVDGELTGKFGRPRTPGAWVTSCCEAYTQFGIPSVMRVLLQVFDRPYNEIRERMEVLSKALSPKLFWMQWQEHLLSHQLGKTVLSQDPSSPGTHAVCEGMASSEAQELVDQMIREGHSCVISARPCLQDGQWEVEAEIHFQGHTLIHRFRSKHKWEQYLSAIQLLPQST